jgi:uncharacterized OB-fold protein
MDNAYKKPLPALNGLAGEFYGWCKRHELRIQRCGGCRTWRHVPREMCAACGSWEWTWERASGRGHVFTWTVAERPMHPAFVGDVPYATVIVELEENVRIVSRVDGCAPADLTIGMPVEVAFDDVTDEVTLPVFRRVG